MEGHRLASRDGILDGSLHSFFPSLSRSSRKPLRPFPGRLVPLWHDVFHFGFDSLFAGGILDVLGGTSRFSVRMMLTITFHLSQ